MLGQRQWLSLVTEFQGAELTAAVVKEQGNSVWVNATGATIATIRGIGLACKSDSLQFFCVFYLSFIVQVNRPKTINKTITNKYISY